jgi:hypothetical protein
MIKYPWKDVLFMSELTEKIYNDIKLRGQYTYSKDFSIKTLEEKALKDLESNGNIIIKSKAIGYVIADAL